MNIMIIGSGRVGSRLAIQLDAEGHQVSIVDTNEDSFNVLPQEFKGFTTCGIPIDQDVLRNANIENCDALAAITPNDNINIMVSQLAKEIFEVPKVLARICDPKREDVFSHFGLHTICPTNITVAAVNSSLTDAQEAQTIHLGTNTISFICKPIEKEQIGTLISDYKIEEPHNAQNLYKKLLSKDKDKKEKKPKKIKQLYGVLHDNNELETELHNNKQLRFVKGDKVVISTLVD